MIRKWKIGDRISIDLGTGTVDRIDADGDLVVTLDNPGFWRTRSLLFKPEYSGLTYVEPLPPEPESGYALLGRTLYYKVEIVGRAQWHNPVNGYAYPWERLIRISQELEQELRPLILGEPIVGAV